ERIGAILREVAALLERGELEPLPHRSVPLARAPSAFRDMAAARHIRQLLIQVPRHLPLDEDGTCRVRGGSGALGAHAARWRAGRGARHLVLASRRPPDAALVAELETLGATVRSVAVDLAESGAARALACDLRTAGPRLRGIVHVA